MPWANPREHSPDHVTDWSARRNLFHTKHPGWLSSSIQHFEPVGFPLQVSAGSTAKPGSGFADVVSTSCSTALPVGCAPEMLVICAGVAHGCTGWLAANDRSTPTAIGNPEFTRFVAIGLVDSGSRNPAVINYSAIHGTVCSD